MRARARATQFASRFISITVTIIVLWKSPPRDSQAIKTRNSGKETDFILNLINYRSHRRVTHVYVIFMHCVYCLSSVQTVNSIAQLIHVSKSLYHSLASIRKCPHDNLLAAVACQWVIHRCFGSKVWNANDDLSSIRLLNCICTIHLLVLQYAFIFKNFIETEYIFFSWLLHLSCEYECCKSRMKLYVCKNMHIIIYKNYRVMKELQ